MAPAQQPKVTITGGADITLHKYAWIVTNHHTSPIVYIEFPHYRADSFTAPEGWATETTNLVNVGVKTRPGICTATPKPPNAGILRGMSAQFQMRITATGADRGERPVKIRFADGTKTTVADIEVPIPSRSGEKFVPIIGTAMILGVWICVRALRRRPAPAPSTGHPHPPQEKT